MLKDFDLSDFWENSPYAREEYVSEKPTPALIASIEEELGYKLPAFYIEMMMYQNGGMPNNTCFPTKAPTSWADNHIAITGIFGIGRKKPYSLCGPYGSQFMIDEWGYPEIGVCVCDCPSGGHDMIMLDYRKNGKNGEPEVVHVDQESDYQITFLARDFETFVRGLVHGDVYDTSEEDLKATLETLHTGSFSDTLQGFFLTSESIDFEQALRNLLTELSKQKGYFALHADELSYLVYDIQFYLYARNKKVRSTSQYLEDYPKMIAFSNGDISTHGYASGFVEDWIHERIRKKQIIKNFFGSLKMSKSFELGLLESVKRFI